MRKRILCLVLAAAAALCLAAPAALASDGEETLPTTGWVGENGHTYYLDENGDKLTGWQQIDGGQYFFRPNGARAEGWTRIDGNTYYFGDDGLYYTGLRYVRDTGNMYLFSDEGVLQKDQKVTLLGREYTILPNGPIDGYLTEASDMAADVLDQVGWDLRAAFNWSAGLTYYGRGTRAPEGEVHSEWYAAYGFTNGYGNCYVMAATFYQMAKLLGYEIYFIEGGVGSKTGTVIDHSWTEMVIDGDTYVFDPDFTNETGIDGYQVWYDKQGTWWYFNPVRTD